MMNRHGEVTRVMDGKLSREHYTVTQGCHWRASTWDARPDLVPRYGTMVQVTRNRHSSTWYEA